MGRSSNVFQSFYDSISDEYTSIAGESSAEFSGTIDTGCYILNALLSKSLYGGLIDNKVTALAGPTGVGKTYICLGIMRSFLESDPGACVVYYDTEAAVTSEMMKERGIDVGRVIISEPETIQKFRTHCLKVLDAYAAQPEDKRKPLLIVLDSLGMLSTSKEVEDSTEGKDTRDMTRAQVIRGAFRTLTLKLAKVKVPLLLTNHVYSNIGGYGDPTVLAGGGGLLYAASTIILLSRSKDKDGKEVVGVFLKAKTLKSRVSKENQEVEMRLSYKTGLDRFYGLLDLAEKAEIVKKVSTRYELPDGRKVFGKEINDNPEQYFTEDIMQQLEEVAKREFSYGL